MVQCRRNCWVRKPSPEHKLDTVPRSRVGVDAGAESGTNVECSDGAVRSSKFNARAPGPEIQRSAHDPWVSRRSAGFRPGAVMPCGAKMLPIKTRASPKAHQGGPELQCKYRSPARRARRGGGACSEDVPDKDVAQMGLPRETWERPPSDTSMGRDPTAGRLQWRRCSVKGWARRRHVSGAVQ